MRFAGVLTAACAVALFGCGRSEPAATAESAVKRWADAINRGDWAGACEMQLTRSSACERRVRSTYAGERLRFNGPAVNGADTQASGNYFSLSGTKAETVFVTAVRKGDTYLIRVDAEIVS